MCPEIFTASSVIFYYEEKGMERLLTSRGCHGDTFTEITSKYCKSGLTL